MNSEDNKNSGGDAPVEQQSQQGIFSSPDLAVNTENLEQIKPELSEDNKSRIASAFQSTDASAKRRAAEAEAAAEQTAQNEARWEQNISGANLTPAAGANLPATTSIPSTATGDIRMPGAKKKSKLPLILLALVVLAAVGGGVAWMVLRGSDEHTPAPALSTSDVVNFANYSLSEDGQQVLANGYVGTRAYRLEQQVKLAQAIGMGGNAEYFNGLGETFNTVYNNTSELFNEETNFTNSDLTAMRDRIAVIRQFVSGSMLTSQNIASLYLAQGDTIGSGICVLPGVSLGAASVAGFPLPSESGSVVSSGSSASQESSDVEGFSS